MSNKITVLQLIAPTQFGGAERVVLSLADAIDRGRFNLICGSFINVHHPDNPFVEELRRRNIPGIIFWLSRTLDVSNIFRIIRTIKERKVDIVHSHGYRSDIIGLIAARAAGRPIVSTIHGWVPINLKLRVYQQCDRIALRYFNWLIPVSDDIQRGLIQSGINPRKMARLHNAVNINTAQGNPKPSAAFHIDKKPGEFLIGNIGRLSPEKRIDIFLQAATLLSAKYDHLKFLIVGDGPERKTLEDKAFALGMNQKIYFTGFVNDLDAIYNCLDLLIITSSTEGIPLTMLEAMKFSIPVIATKVGGIPEVIEDGFNGLLTEPGDLPQLMTYIEKLVAEKGFYLKLAAHAKKKIEERFNLSSWARAIEKIYLNLLPAR